jgi:hypothetical protein
MFTALPAHIGASGNPRALPTFATNSGVNTKEIEIVCEYAIQGSELVVTGLAHFAVVEDPVVVTAQDLRDGMLSRGLSIGSKTPDAFHSSVLANDYGLYISER